MKTEFDDALHGYYHEYDEVQSGEQTTDYKQIGPLAVCSLVAAFLAILGFFWSTFIIFAIAGAVMGVLALRKILKAPEEIGGFALSTAGIGLSILIGLSAVIWQTWCYYHNAPPGYEIVDFNSMGLDAKTGKIPEDILALDGRKVFVQGFMYPTNRNSGLEEFTMVRTLAHCKFCDPGTNPADMIAVEMENGMTVNYRANKKVNVGGIFHVNPEFVSGEIPYSIEANVFR